MDWIFELIVLLLKAVLGILFALLKLLLNIAILLSPVIIIAVIVYIVKRKKEIEVEKEKKRIKEIEDRRKCEYKKESEIIYAENLHRLYDHRSTSELVKIHELLEVMHYNEWDSDCKGSRVAADRAYCEASKKLVIIMGNPSWKMLCRNGKVEYCNFPVHVTTDMNYVYRVLKSRGVTNW